MKIKRLAITIFTVLFVAFTLISFFAYDKSSSVSIVCEDKSYAEKYAKLHNIDYKILSDSDKNIGLVNLDDFKYNEDGSLVSYTGDSETIAIPESIGETPIVRVKADAFDKADKLKEIYVSKTLLIFEPNDLKGVTIYVPEDSLVYNLMQWKDKNKINLSIGENTEDVVVSNYDDFNVSVDGTLEAYTGDDSIISIPAKIGDLKIRRIAKDAFITAKRLTKVYLPESLEKFEPMRVENVEFCISTKSDAYKDAKDNKSKVDFSSNTDHSKMAASLDEDFDYNENGQILEYRGTDQTVVIPEEINGTKIISVNEKAFDKAKDTKTIYLPETMIAFWPETLDGVKVYAPSDAPINNIYADKKFDYVTYADSYYVNFYSANIPYSYDDISNDEVRVNSYNGEDKNIIIPETIDGKKVTAISVDAFGVGAESILIPGTVDKIETKLYTAKYDAAFYIGLVTALLGFALATVAVLKLKLDESKEKNFLRLTVLRLSYTISVMSVILAVAYMFVLPRFVTTPVWLGGVFSVLVVAFGVIALIKTNTATELVEKVGKEVKEKTFFIKSLTVDADVLVSKAQSEETKTVAKKVYEAVRYSDPMSSDKLTGVETRIENLFFEFKSAVSSNNTAMAKQIGTELLETIEERNKKCKMLK
ncbi:MAG: hypothetical protein SPI76_03170 [Candidatus Fimenecus sp.]|nr:hypothetical protein [Candidatus Fimenecus sp.]